MFQIISAVICFVLFSISLINYVFDEDKYLRKLDRNAMAVALACCVCNVVLYFM